jgi:hypothetical protein
MLLRRSGLYSPLSLALIMLLYTAVSAGAARLELDGTTLDFNIPQKIHAYDSVPVECRLNGTGDVTVQVVATDSAAHEKYFDSGVPHKIAFRIDYLSESGEHGTFRITNIGDTIWKTCGHGVMSSARFSAPYVFFSADVVPGESVTKTYPINRMRPEGGKASARVFSVNIRRDGDRLPRGEQSRVELIVDDCKPGWSGTKEVVLSAVGAHDDFDEFGHAFIRRQLTGQEVAAKMNVLMPPWADRLVVRLIKDGQMKAVSVPVRPSEQSLRLKPAPNKRWTLNGKPVFILDSLPRISIEQMAEVRERLGGDNIVLVCEAELNPNSEWLQAVRKYGFKIMPVSLGYVRLQRIGEIAGYDLMRGAPSIPGIQRVDALDPNFHLAMADVVDKYYEACKDVLYRTADGMVPICLSEEQSYGFPFGGVQPVRWGGSSPANVIAFRMWLRAKYHKLAKLNEAWGTEYEDFEEIDPSVLCSLPTTEYPDPWKEWGPALEDFDTFRSKIHGEFWTRTVEEIKKRRTDVLCGLNLYADFASKEEPIYNGFFEWGVTDYQGKPVNWAGRRAAVMPDDMMALDFFVCWNTGSPEAAKKNIEFWRNRGKDIVIYGRPWSKVVMGGDQEIRGHAPLYLGKKGRMISQSTSFFTTFKATYDAGGVAGILNDSYIGNRMNELQRREIELYNKEVARAAGEQ